jgi:hypothetical protein
MKEMKKIMMVFMVLILQVFAKCPFGQIEKGGECVNNYLVNMANILILVFLGISGIVYMVGNAFASPRVIEYSKELLKITLQNAFILFIIYFLFSWLDTAGSVLATSSLAYPGRSVSRNFRNWTGMQDYIEDYLKGLKADLANGLAFVMGISFYGGLIGSMSMFFTLEVAGIQQSISFPVGSSFGSLLSFLSYAMTLMVTVILNIELQYQVFKIIGRNLITVLLPLGIFLRIFPLTRGAGSAVLAVAIGFGVFLPIAYIINRDIGEEVCGTESFEWSELIGRMSGKLQDPSGLIDYLRENLRLPGEEDEDGFFGIFVCKYGIEGFLIPFFAYVMILNLIRHLAEIMGTHIDLSTLVRIV